MADTQTITETRSAAPAADDVVVTRMPINLQFSDLVAVLESRKGSALSDSISDAIDEMADGGEQEPTTAKFNSGIRPEPVAARFNSGLSPDRRVAAKFNSGIKPESDN